MIKLPCKFFYGTMALNPPSNNKQGLYIKQKKGGNYEKITICNDYGISLKY